MSGEKGIYEKGMILFMGRMIKGYLVFASAAYRIAMYILMPILMMGLIAWTGSNIEEAALLLAASLLTMAEILSDSWLFGGIQARDPEKIDYLKTSVRGMGLLRNALIMDLVRKLLFSLLVVGMGYLVLRLGGAASLSGKGLREGYADMLQTGTKAGILLCFALTSCFFSTVGTFLSRFGSLFWINLLISYPCMILTVLCPFLMTSSGHNIWLFNLLNLLLCAGAGALAVHVAMRKFEGGFYDK